MKERARLLTERIYALEEPWRTRFLHLVASRFQTSNPGGGTPTDDEIAAVLANHLACSFVAALLRRWTHCDIQP